MSSPSNAYPVVQFLVARGRHLSFALCGLIEIACIWAAVQSGALWLVPAGTVAAALLLGLLLSYVEVLSIIADTLIPKY